jgi:CubicO group peptidase (beta-lactamase class C family)
LPSFCSPSQWPQLRFQRFGRYETHFNGRVTVVLSVFLLFSHAAFSVPTPTPAKSATEETNSLPTGVSKTVNDAVTKMLSESGVPSASIAVVKDGKLAYAQNYGLADFASHRSATTSMIYSIGSISTQFTAASILLLAEKANSCLMIPSDG